VSKFTQPKKKQKKAPHRGRHPRVKTTGKLAKKTLAAVENVNQREDDLDRGYGQLARQYEITPDQYGNSLDVAEIDSLIGERQKMLALIDEEKKDLEEAIEALKRAIAALLKAIHEEQEAIRQDVKKIRDERRKKKPNQKLITSLEGRYEQAAGPRRPVPGADERSPGWPRRLEAEPRARAAVRPARRRARHHGAAAEPRGHVIKAIADAQSADSGGGSTGDSGGGGGDRAARPVVSVATAQQ
jgi:exonuclease VII small subunit